MVVTPRADSRNAAARTGKRFHGSFHVRHGLPIVARFSRPGGALEGSKGNAGQSCCFHRIGTDLRRKGMRGINQPGDGIGLHPVRQALRPAKAANPRFDRLGARSVDAAGIGQHGIDTRIGAGARQKARFARSTQNEDTAHG